MARGMVKVGRYWIVFPAGLLLAACAGGFSDDRTITHITTEPPGARCTLHGAGFNQVIQTPAHVVLPKDAAPITVTCAGAGYRTFVTSLKPEFNGEVMANLLTGSIIAMVVDFTNGHGLKFPPNVHINMEPTVFSTVEARDRWFNRYREHVLGKWSDVVGGIRNNCDGPDAESAHCRAQLQAAEESQARELGLLEQRRRQAPIGHVDTAEHPPAAE